MENDLIKRTIDLSKVLHYGAIISINLAEEDFHMFSDGFIQKTVNLQKNLENNDFFGTLFRIVPNYQYEVQKQIIKISKEMDRNINSYL